MSLKQLKDYTFVSKYARYNEILKRRETWHEAVTRVKEMHLKKYPHVSDIIEKAFEFVYNKHILGSQRSLQFGGSGIERNNLRLYNCAFSYCDRPRFFAELFFCLLSGTGAGFSVQKHHVAKLPKLNLRDPEDIKYIIEDSIEGWANAIDVLFKSYYNQENKNIIFDYSQIRPKGSKLSTSSGKAPGPEPLKNCLQKIKTILDIVNGRDGILKPIECFDISMHIADAVLSGGHRRSATIALFSHDDEEMLNAKTGKWFYENPQRGRANISAVLLRSNTSEEVFNSIFLKNKEFGEPGFFWTDDLEVGSNPCCEIGFYTYDDNGNSGWGLCNLTEINGKKSVNKDVFLQQCWAATVLGTIQAGYNTFTYLGDATENIVRKEALLGVSITGIMENQNILFNEEILTEAIELIRKTNKEIAELIGINAAARLTTIKPSGTSSCILGTSSGIHPHHAKRYLRRIQSNKLEPPLQFFESINPMAVEDSVWSSSKSDAVITFCIEVEDGSKTKNDISALELLEKVKFMKTYWVNNGTNIQNCIKPYVRHNVSNTINVKDEEWLDVKNFIYENREYFSGISLLPHRGDLDYQQAPFTAVKTPKELVLTYGDGILFCSGLIELALDIFDNLWIACDIILGIKNSTELVDTFRKVFEDLSPNNQDILVKSYEEDIKEFLEKVKRFAEKYFNSNIQLTTYALKEVYNWKTWVDLQREYKDVNYKDMIEEDDNTNLEQELACVGGSCEI